MKIEDLVALTKAGYTKADIEALGILSSPEPKEETPAEPVAEPVEAESSKEPVAESTDRYKELETKLDYVINRFNYMSVQNSTQPEQKTESVEDILQSILK